MSVDITLPMSPTITITSPVGGAGPGAGAGLTPLELERRRHFIGASEVATIMGVNPFENAATLWYRKVHNIPVDDNPAMRRGRLMERYILHEASESLGLRIIRQNRRRVHPNGAMQATVDAWVVGEPAILEAKKVMWYAYRAHKDRWGESGTDHVPDTYQLQAQAQMAVATASSGIVYETVYLAALIGDDDLRIYHIRRNQGLIDLIERAVCDWVDLYLIPQVEPPFVPCEDVLKKLRRDPGKEAVLDDGDVAGLLSMKQALEVAKERHDAARDKVIHQLGDAEIGRSSHGRITYFEQSRSGIDSKLLRRELPDVWQQYEKKSAPFRVLRTP